MNDHTENPNDSDIRMRNGVQPVVAAYCLKCGNKPANCQCDRQLLREWCEDFDEFTSDEHRDECIDRFLAERGKST